MSTSLPVLRREIDHIWIGARGKNSWVQTTSVLLVTVALAVRLYQLTSRYAVNVFFFDQWDFNNGTVFEKHSLWEIFTWEHLHRQGMGGVLSKLIEPLFHWNSRSEGFLGWGMVVLGACLALYLKTRLYGPLTFWDCVIPIVFLNPAQYEVIVGAFNLAYGLVSVVLLVCYFLAWTIRRPTIRYPLMLLVNFMTIFTGWGLFIGCVTPVLLLFDYFARLKNMVNGKAWFWGSFAGSLASMAVFFHNYIFVTATDCFSPQWTSPRSYLRFMYIMFASLFGHKGTGQHERWFGLLVMAALLCMLIITAKRLLAAEAEDCTRNIVIAGMIGYAFLFSFNTSIGRVCLGLPQALGSQYIPYLQFGVLGGYFYFLGIRGPIRRNAPLAVLGFLILHMVPVQPADRFGMGWFRWIKSTWRECYFAGGTIETCNQLSHPGVHPRPELTHLAEKLEYLRKTKQNLFADAP